MAAITCRVRGTENHDGSVAQMVVRKSALAATERSPLAAEGRVARTCVRGPRRGERVPEKASQTRLSKAESELSASSRRLELEKWGVGDNPQPVVVRVSLIDGHSAVLLTRCTQIRHSRLLRRD